MKVNIEVQGLCTDMLRGIPYYTINLVEALVKRGNNDYAISFYDYLKERNNRDYIDKYISQKYIESIDILECNSLSYRAIMDGNMSEEKAAYASKPYNQYFGKRCDVYHFPNVHNIPQNIVSKTIVTVHDIIPLIPEFADGWNIKGNKQFETSLRFVKDRQDIEIVADSFSTKKDLIERMNIESNRIHVVPLAYDTKTHYVEKDKEVLKEMGIEGPFIAYLGVLDFRKGIVDILDAFEILKEKNKDIKLVLAGRLDKAVTPIWDRLKDYKYIDDVILTGFISERQKRVLLSSAKVFLFPSEYEGFGLPVLEAMACGAPVITTSVSSLPEVGGEAALYVTPKNAEELAVTIERLLDSETLRNEYITKGFNQCKKFSWDKTAEMTENVYDYAIKK